MKSKVAVAAEALKNVETSSEIEKQLLEVAKLALRALRAVKRDDLEKAMELVPSMAQAADRAGLSVVGEVMGNDFGPYTQPPVFTQYN